jgi:hypothetical protein
MFCEFIPIGNYEYRCANCNILVTSSEGPPILPCPNSLNRDNDVGFLEKIQNFISATTQHIQNGMPMCTDEQIIKRHNICMTCEHYDNNTCKQCGCPLFRTKRFVSKLAWADQECPIGKWGKENN